MRTHTTIKAVLIVLVVLLSIQNVYAACPNVPKYQQVYTDALGPSRTPAHDEFIQWVVGDGSPGSPGINRGLTTTQVEAMARKLAALPENPGSGSVATVPYEVLTPEQLGKYARDHGVSVPAVDLTKPTEANRGKITQALLERDLASVPRDGTYQVVPVEGEVVTGRISGITEKGVQLTLADGTTRTIAPADLSRLEPVTPSAGLPPSTLQPVERIPSGAVEKVNQINTALKSTGFEIVEVGGEGVKVRRIGDPTSEQTVSLANGKTGTIGNFKISTDLNGDIVVNRPGWLFGLGGETYAITRAEQAPTPSAAGLSPGGTPAPIVDGAKRAVTQSPTEAEILSRQQPDVARQELVDLAMSRAAAKLRVNC